MFKDYKYSIIFITHISSFFRFLPLSASTVRMSEGTFCRVEVHIEIFSTVKIKNFIRIFFIFFLFLLEAILTCTHNLCFGAKISIPLYVLPTIYVLEQK